MKHIAFFCLALAVALTAQPLSAQQLEIRFLDVGQGDAAVLRTPDGKKILIDAGRGSGVMSYLTAEHYDTLDLVIASHNHADHIGEMAGVLSSIPVRFYLDNGLAHTTATYGRTLAALERSGAQYLRASSRTITLGSVHVRVLSLPPGGTDQNNQSVGVVVQFGEFRALFTGDSELAELAYWLKHDSVPWVHVVKVAHRQLEWHQPSLGAGYPPTSRGNLCWGRELLWPSVRRSDCAVGMGRFAGVSHGSGWKRPGPGQR